MARWYVMSGDSVLAIKDSKQEAVALSDLWDKRYAPIHHVEREQKS